MRTSNSESVGPLGGIGWRGAIALLRSEPSHSRILGGSLVMLTGSGLVSAVNFGYNVAVFRLLGDADYGNAAAAVTLLMLVSAITLSFQLVCAKFVARGETPGSKAAVYSNLLRRAWMVGIVLGSAMAFGSRFVAEYLNLPSANLVVALAAGMAFYIPLGVKRGGMQGVCSFSRLTMNFILEVLVKFLGAILLIKLGYGVMGAVTAIAASVILAYFLPPTPAELQAKAESAVRASFREGMQAIVFFVGQVVINNIDIILVKHFFSSGQAGLYSAVALVGRVVYMFSWSVVSAMFPISAGAKREDDNASVLVVPLLIVMLIALAFTAGLGLFPGFALHVIFGVGQEQTAHGLDSLLMLYAAATGAYSLSVVLMAYEMSRKLANSGWVQASFSGAIVVGIYFFHSTLRQVVVVQLVLMVFLLIASAVPFFRVPSLAISGEGATAAALVSAVAAPRGTTTAFGGSPRGMRRVRRVPEAEVIAAFLKNEFHHAEFQRDRTRFEQLVTNGDLRNEAENALRRALLFRRRGTMWRELPPDTEWYEVEMTPADIEKLRVFPRAQWRRLASGSFLLTDIVARIRSNHFLGRTRSFIERVKALSKHLKANANNSAILLIGIDDEQPLTILEGNHRVTAAMLASPSVVRNRFRWYCGFSPRMMECCWYQTNLSTLYRYARNRLKILMYDREADIAQLLAHHGQNRDALLMTAEPPPVEAAESRQAS